MTVKEMKEFLNHYDDDCEVSLHICHQKNAYETSIVIQDGATEEGGLLLRQVLAFEKEHPFVHE